MAERVDGDAGDLLLDDLDVQSDSPWRLAYLIPAGVFEAALAGPRQLYRLQVAGLFTVAGLLASIAYALLNPWDPLDRPATFVPWVVLLLAYSFVTCILPVCGRTGARERETRSS